MLSADYEPPAVASVRVDRRMSAGQIAGLLSALGPDAPEVTATAIVFGDDPGLAARALAWLRAQRLEHTVTVTRRWVAPEPARRVAGTYPATPVDCLLSTLSESELWTDESKRAAISDMVALARDSHPRQADRYPAAPIDHLLTAVSNAAQAWPPGGERDHALGAVAEARAALGA